MKKFHVQPWTYGWGLFAVAPIAAGEVIEPLVGYETDYEPLSADLKRLVIYLGNGRYFVITNEVVFANHGCDPNCRLDDAGLVALRDITPSEQLTFNYNLFSAERQSDPEEDWWWDPLWSFDCACGSQNCQGRIDGYRFIESTCD
jgi:SET domain-containing protein